MDDFIQIPEILNKYRTIAVVGCSKDPTKDSNIVARAMMGYGYKVIPVNPTADEILGLPCYHSLSEIKEHVDVVDVFRPGAEALEITKQAASIGAKVVWLQEGIKSNEAMEYAKGKGIEFIQDKCVMKEYRKM